MMTKGRVVFEGPIPSAFLESPRWIRVYLPRSYDSEPARRFPTLYIHDGQNAFSTVGPHVAFGWGNWALDTTVDELTATKRMAEIILVAIDCSPERYQEYRGPADPSRPQRAMRTRGRMVARPPTDRFERYTRFLIEELKPWIDQHYRTVPRPRSTGLLGSSMGGLCSVALAWQKPSVFGLAASLSGAFQVQNRRFIVHGLRTYVGKPKRIRFYLDSGVTDDSGGEDGRAHTAAVAHELRRIGWRDGINLLHFVDDRPLSEEELNQLGLPSDKRAEARFSQHNELYWRLRVWRALTFLFPPGLSPTGSPSAVPPISG